MKFCPNCKAELDDNARFCLRCMTSLIEKEPIPPPVLPARRWPLVLLCALLLPAMLVIIIVFRPPAPTQTPAPSLSTVLEAPTIPPLSNTTKEPSTLTHTADGVCYTFRSATKEDHPTAIILDNYFVLIRVDGTPSDGIYRVPSFVGQDTSALVVAVTDGAFAGTNACSIDLGYNVRYVWGNAFGGYALTNLYLHEDVFIDQAAFSGCTGELTIHCPDYLENNQGILWSDLAASCGFRWQPEDL